MGFGERVAEFDDRSAVTVDGTNGRNKGAIVAGWVIASVFIVALSVAFAAIPDSAKGWASLVVLVVAILFLTGYVIWRRKRNRRLTGSPTTYPNR